MTSVGLIVSDLAPLPASLPEGAMSVLGGNVTALTLVLSEHLAPPLSLCRYLPWAVMRRKTWGSLRARCADA